MDRLGITKSTLWRWLKAEGVVETHPQRLTEWKRHRPTTRRTNVGDSYHGLVRVRVSCSSALNRRITGWIAGINDSVGSSVRVTHRALDPANPGSSPGSPALLSSQDSKGAEPSVMKGATTHRSGDFHWARRAATGVPQSGTEAPSPGSPGSLEGRGLDMTHVEASRGHLP